MKHANYGRRGRPFVLPPAMGPVVKRMLVSMRLSWRGLEGVLSSLLPVKAPDLTTLWKRLAALNAEPAVPPREAIVAVDSTGFSTTLRGEWMRDRWHRRRGFVKAHVAVDVDTLDVLGVIVTDDTVHDAEVFVPLVQRVLDHGTRIKRVLADGAHDTFGDLDLLRRHGIEAGIMIRKSAGRKLRGHTFARPCAVRERDLLGAWLWERRYAYSLRWMVEYVFSAVKRTLGSEVRSRDRDLMFLEVRNKFWTWNDMRAEELRN